MKNKKLLCLLAVGVSAILPLTSCGEDSSSSNPAVTSSESVSAITSSESNPAITSSESVSAITSSESNPAITSAVDDTDAITALKSAVIGTMKEEKIGLDLAVGSKGLDYSTTFTVFDGDKEAVNYTRDSEIKINSADVDINILNLQKENGTLNDLEFGIKVDNIEIVSKSKMDYIIETDNQKDSESSSTFSGSVTAYGKAGYIYEDTSKLTIVDVDDGKTTTETGAKTKSTYDSFGLSDENLTSKIFPLSQYEETVTQYLTYIDTFVPAIEAVDDTIINFSKAGDEYVANITIADLAQFTKLYAALSGEKLEADIKNISVAIDIKYTETQLSGIDFDINFAMDSVKTTTSASTDETTTSETIETILYTYVTTYSVNADLDLDFKYGSDVNVEVPTDLTSYVEE